MPAQVRKTVGIGLAAAVAAAALWYFVVGPFLVRSRASSNVVEAERILVEAHRRSQATHLDRLVLARVGGTAVTAADVYMYTVANEPSAAEARRAVESPSADQLQGSYENVVILLALADWLARHETPPSRPKTAAQMMDQDLGNIARTETAATDWRNAMAVARWRHREWEFMPFWQAQGVLDAFLAPPAGLSPDETRRFMTEKTKQVNGLVAQAKQEIEPVHSLSDLLRQLKGA